MYDIITHIADSFSDDVATISYTTARIMTQAVDQRSHRFAFKDGMCSYENFEKY